MSSVTRIPLCSVSFCPAPSDPDWHACIMPGCGSPKIEHHHVEGRGRNLKKKKSVVALCTPHHKSISLNVWHDVLLYDDKGEPLEYIVMDLHGETIHEVKLGADSAAEDGGSSMAEPPSGQLAPRGDAGSSPAPLSPAAPSPVPEADGAAGVAELVDAADLKSAVREDERVQIPPPALTHERCVELTAQIRDTQRNRQWRAGDLGNLFVRVLNEKADQYICDFGFAEPTIANILKVCEAVTPEERHDDVSFGHCAVYYKQNREDRDMWRDVVLEEKLTVRELRERVHGKRPEPMVGCPACPWEGQRSALRRVT